MHDGIADSSNNNRHQLNLEIYREDASVRRLHRENVLLVLSTCHKKRMHDYAAVGEDSYMLMVRSHLIDK